MKLLFIFIALEVVLASVFLLTGDLPVVPDVVPGSAFDLSLTTILFVVGGLIEIAFRLYPTSRNLSILHLIVTAIDKIVPNQATEKDTGKKGIFKLFKQVK